MSLKSIRDKIKSKTSQCDAKKAAISKKALLGFPVFLTMFMFLCTAASASILNTTAITGIFTDLGSIFPAIGDFIIQVMPTIMTLAVVGFVLKFFDKILSIFDKVF
jgi:hypothetical protein